MSGRELEGLTVAELEALAVAVALEIDTREIDHGPNVTEDALRTLEAAARRDGWEAFHAGAPIRPMLEHLITERDRRLWAVRCRWREGWYSAEAHGLHPDVQAGAEQCGAVRHWSYTTGRGRTAQEHPAVSRCPLPLDHAPRACLLWTGAGWSDLGELEPAKP